MLVLLLQLNGDLPEVFPGHERRIYVLGCRRKTCRRKEGSVRALRGVRITQTVKKPTEIKAEEPKAAAHIGESLFGAKAASGGAGLGNPFSMGGANSNPFSTSSASTTAGSSNPFAVAGLPPSSVLSAKPPQATSPSSDLPKTFASALSLNNTQAKTFGPPPPPQPWPQESELPPPYPSYYLEDDIEWLDKISEPEMPPQMMEIDESGSSGGGKEDKEVYESTIDKQFQKFADRLAQNPEQVIRYEFKGHPLLYSKSDEVGKLFSSGSGGEGKVRVDNGSGSRIPRCANCGSGRVFEVQLTPHAIMELESEEAGLDGMEWGTVVVGVCEKDCNEKGVEGTGVGYVEEWAGVQWEELRR